ncbi:MAG: CCA tRNA nucleotidyltransferase [Deltaproteobacteria bacterium]
MGGCVRDSAMGIAPKEYDIATSATPDVVMGLFERAFPIGASFGVALVLEGDYKFEVATFRRDLGYADGRHPCGVLYTEDEREDVLRRDFTINGMLSDPETGECFDYIGGIGDIKRRMVRTIGDARQRFAEDKLRMMRAARFASRFQFEIEQDTGLAISELAPQIQQVSAERIRDEIVKIISQENPGLGLRTLAEFGLLALILPDVERMRGVAQPPEFHPEGDVFIHTCLVLDKLRETAGGEISLELAMGALLHDVGKPPTFTVSDRIRFNGHDRVGADMSRRILRDLKFSNKQVEAICSLIREHLKFKDTFDMRDATLKRFLGMENFGDHLKMHLADCLASHGMRGAYDFVRQKLAEFSREQIAPKPLIGGRDLIEMGYKPGPIFTEILRSVEEAQLEGELKDADEARRFVAEKFTLAQ